MNKIDNNILCWSNNPELEAIEQAKNISKHPWLVGNVCLMPDTHCGYGMPIGGVVALKGAVCPNMVGVDIGCFTGDTLIPLISGEKKTLYELVEMTNKNNDFYIFALNKDLQITTEKATAFKTRNNAELMEVCISGGSIIRCTPDHKFMLINGTYKEAKDLIPKDSLMPLYRSYQTKDGYESVMSYHSKSKLTHKIVAEYKYGDINGKVIHHKDFKWYNNHPNNLELLTPEEHSRIHGKNNNIFKDKSFKANRLKKLQEKGFYDKKLYNKKVDVGTNNIKKYMIENKESFLDAVKNNGKRGAEYLIKFNKANNNTTYICEYCGRKIKGKGGFIRHINNCKLNNNKNNHKVLWTKKLNYKEDVYCLNVPNYHNFALDAGIFVHNCGMLAVKTSLIEITTEQLKNILGGSKEFKGGIRANIPVGFNKHNKDQECKLFDDDRWFYSDICGRELSNAKKQLGTLGGGNHFIEIQKGDDNHIWFMIHSGSRNLGYQVAKHYNNIANELCKQWKQDEIVKNELAILPFGTEECDRYLQEMQLCLDFAYENRNICLI